MSGESRFCCYPARPSAGSLSHHTRPRHLDLQPLWTRSPACPAFPPSRSFGPGYLQPGSSSPSLRALSQAKDAALASSLASFSVLMLLGLLIVLATRNKLQRPGLLCTSALLRPSSSAVSFCSNGPVAWRGPCFPDEKLSHLSRVILQEGTLLRSV